MPANDAAGWFARHQVLPPDVNASDKDFTPIYLPAKPEPASIEGVIRLA